MNKTEIFIEKCKNIYENRFTYDKVDYINSTKKVIITCKIHGDFEITPSNFLSNHSCKKCAISIRTNNLDYYVDKLNKFHNNFYDYSKVIYKGTNKNITIICPIHGEFEQRFSTHLTKSGCRKCGDVSKGIKNTLTLQEVLDRFKEVHNDRYNYSKVEYTLIDNKVIIICKIHGEFLQVPRMHMCGVGCPECNLYIGYSKSKWINYNKGKEGIFYILKCQNENEEFYKVGITSRSIKKRFFSTSAMPYNYKIIKEEKSYNLEYIWNLEKEWKNKLKDFKYKPQISFNGSSKECFTEIKN